MANNPRSRDRTAFSSVMTPATRLPSIPSLRDPGSKPDLSTFGREVYAFAAAVKQVLDVRLAAANVFERWMTLRDIAALGLDGGTVRGDAPLDAIGIPMWTSRGKHDLVSLLALANALSGYLTTTSATTSSAPAPSPSRAAQGVSPDQLAADLKKLEMKLRQAWADDIAAAVKALAPQFSGLADQITQVLAKVDLNFRGFVYVRTTSGATWTITHNMDKYPQVTVLNTSHEVVYADVTYTDYNTVTVTHGASVMGAAFCT